MTEEFDKKELEGERRLEKLAQSFTEHIDNNRFNEAYEIFKAQPKVVGYTMFTQLDWAYTGFRNHVSEEAGKELSDYIIKQVEDWGARHKVWNALVMPLRNKFRSRKAETN